MWTISMDFHGYVRSRSQASGNWGHLNRTRNLCAQQSRESIRFCHVILNPSIDATRESAAKNWFPNSKNMLYCQVLISKSLNSLFHIAALGLKERLLFDNRGFEGMLKIGCQKEWLLNWLFIVIFFIKVIRGVSRKQIHVCPWCPCYGWLDTPSVTQFWWLNNNVFHGNICHIMMPCWYSHKYIYIIIYIYIYISSVYYPASKSSFSWWISNLLQSQ